MSGGDGFWLPPARTAGSDAIPDGSSTKVVAHGIDATPKTVLATPKANDRVWVSARDETTFTVARAGTTGDLEFDWLATGIAGAPPPPFSPLDIAWHTAFWAEGPNFAAEGYGNGAAVHSWPDETGNGRHATQATGASQPAYRATVSALNNRPAIQGDNSNDKLRTAAFTALPNPLTIVLVGNIASSGDHFYDGIVSSNRAMMSGGGTWSIYNGSTVVSGGAADTIPHLFIATFASGSGDTDRLTVDGSQVIAANSGTHTLTGINLFSNFTTTADAHSGGHIAFFGLKDGLLTTDEKDALLAWAQEHYATP